MGQQHQRCDAGSRCGDRGNRRLRGKDAGTALVIKSIATGLSDLADPVTFDMAL